jgi:hypothetical protein
MRDVNEVDDVSAYDTIQVVSNGARRDEEQGAAPESWAAPPEQENGEQADHRGPARDDQERHPDALRNGPEKVEGDVRVLDVPEVEDAVDQGTRASAL